MVGRRKGQTENGKKKKILGKEIPIDGGREGGREAEGKAERRQSLWAVLRISCQSQWAVFDDERYMSACQK